MITKSEEFGNCGNKIHSNFGENAFDKMNLRGNYRIASMEYNALTGELTINQYPDIAKTVILGDSSVSKNNTMSHKDVIEEILDWANMSINDFNNLKKDKNYVVYNANNPESEKYLYYIYNKATGEWVSSILADGDEFFNISDTIKYRYENNKLVDTINVSLTARNTVIDGKSTGITLEVSPTTGDSVHLDLVGEQYAGLMSSEDKLKLDNLNSRIGAILELGQADNGGIPLYLKTMNGEVLSSVILDEDDYITDINATIATEDIPDKGIHIGDRVMVFTLTNSTKLIVSLEGWFLKYKGIKTDSIDLAIINDTIKADLLISPNTSNLSKMTSEGLLTTLIWRDTPDTVKFLKGQKEDYSDITYKGYVYFAIDTKEVIVDGIAYGLDITAPNLDLIKKIESTNIVGEFLITNSNDSTYKISIPTATVTSNGLLSKGDKIKLSAIEDYSQVNKVEGVKIGNSVQTIVNKIVTLDTYTKSEINSKTDSRLYYKGESASIGTIPTEDRQVGDTKKITSEKIGLATNALVYWDGAKWSSFTGNLDLAEYATKKDLGNQSSADLSDINKKLEEKVNKVEGKDLVLNDEADKLLYIDTYIKDISETIVEGKINLNVNKRTPSSKGLETIEKIILSNSDSVHNGLMSSKHYNVVEALQSSDNYLDKTGTPSPTWQLSKNTGPKIKNSGGEFGLRNSADDDYTGLTVKNLTITGNVTQLGGSFITEAQTVEVVDNTVLLNKGEVGAGVTKGYAGLEIDRGTLPKYNIYFDESDDRFKAGQTGNEQPIMLRDEDTDLTDGAILSWDGTSKRAKTNYNIDSKLADYLPLTGGIIKWGLSVGGGIKTSAIGGLKGNTTVTFLNFDGRDIVAMGNAMTGSETAVAVPPSKSLIIYRNNTLTQGAKVWDEVNDGPESGLDADLLDGKHAAEFQLAGNYAPTVHTHGIVDIADIDSTWSVPLNSSVYKKQLQLNGATWFNFYADSDSPVGPFYAPTTKGINGQFLRATTGEPMWETIDATTLGALSVNGGRVGGTLEIATAGKLTSLSNGDSSYFTVNTDATKGTLFNKDVYVVGDLYGGTEVSPKKVAYASELSWGSITGKPSVIVEGDVRLGNARPANGGSADTIRDYGNTSKLIKIGYEGTGLTTVTHIAGYDTSSGEIRIKDISIDNLKNVINSLPASDVSAWAKAATKPTYTASEISGALSTDNIVSRYTVGALPSNNDSGIPTTNLLAYWDGCYAGGVSNLTYCTKGAFGSAVTYNVGDIVTVTGNQSIAGAKTFTSAVTCSMGFYDTSDIRLKTNIQEIELKPKKINLYEFDKGESHSYGVIAQEIEELYPSTVKENEEGYKVVNYSEVLTIKCVELETENKILKDRLDKLEQLLMRQGIL